MTITFTGQNVGTWSAARIDMELDRIVARSLRGGTMAMRAMGTVFLPPDFRESKKLDQYVSRVLHTTLFPAYDDAVRDLAGKPFQRNVKLKGTELLSPALQELESDADREGMNLTSFLRATLEAMWDTGVGHILVDKPGSRVPVAPASDAAAPAAAPAPDAPVETRAMSLQEERDAGVRPYFVMVSLDNLIGWTYQDDATGRRRLESIRIASEREEWTNDGPVIVQSILAYMTDRWERWERPAPKPAPAARQSGVLTQLDLSGAVDTARRVTQAITDTATHYRRVATGPNPLGFVPLVSRNISPMGSDRFRARLPLAGLAYKNVEDWQIASCESNNLRWHTYPVLAGSGMPSEYVEGTEKIIYGAGATILSTNPDMKVGLMETTGAAAQKLSDKRASLRSEMNALGQQPFMEARSAGTAFGSAVDESRSQTRAQAAAEEVEWLAYEAFEMAARWQGETLPEDFDVSVWREFTPNAEKQSNLQTLDAARGRRDLSRETYLQQLQRFGVLDSNVDIDAELQRINDEGPSLGSLVPGSFGGAPSPFGNRDQPQPEPAPADAAAQ